MIQTSQPLVNEAILRFSQVFLDAGLLSQDDLLRHALLADSGLAL